MELTFLIYKHEKMRDYILAGLGDHPDPLSLSAYWKLISKRNRGGILGLYWVLDGLFRIALY
jgi:hypothetical protein